MNTAKISSYNFPFSMLSILTNPPSNQSILFYTCNAKLVSVGKFLVND